MSSSGAECLILHSSSISCQWKESPCETQAWRRNSKKVPWCTRYLGSVTALLMCPKPSAKGRFEICPLKHYSLATLPQRCTSRWHAQILWQRPVLPSAGQEGSGEELKETRCPGGVLASQAECRHPEQHSAKEWSLLWEPTAPHPEEAVPLVAFGRVGDHWATHCLFESWDLSPTGAAGATLQKLPGAEQDKQESQEKARMLWAPHSS